MSSIFPARPGKADMPHLRELGRSAKELDDICDRIGPRFSACRCGSLSLRRGRRSGPRKKGRRRRRRVGADPVDAAGGASCDHAADHTPPGPAGVGRVVVAMTTPSSARGDAVPLSKAGPRPAGHESAAVTLTPASTLSSGSKGTPIYLFCYSRRNYLRSKKRCFRCDASNG